MHIEINKKKKKIIIKAKIGKTINMEIIILK